MINKHKSHLFIVFEGPEGVGKSTQLALLATRLERLGHRVVSFAEPGGSPLAEQIRQIFKAPAEPPSPEEELCLVTAARIARLRRQREIAADQTIVLCDRYFDSTLAYQHLLGGVPISTVQQVSSVARLPVPHLTLHLDASPEILERRLASRGGQDRQDRLSPAAISTAYRQIREQQIPYPCWSVPSRVRVEAGGWLGEVERLVWETLTTAIGGNFCG